MKEYPFSRILFAKWRKLCHKRNDWDHVVEKVKEKEDPKKEKILLLLLRSLLCAAAAATSFLPSFLPSIWFLHLLLQQQAAPPLLLLLFLFFRFWVIIMKKMMQMMTRGNKRTVMIWHDSSISLALLSHHQAPHLFLPHSLTHILLSCCCNKADVRKER